MNMEFVNCALCGLNETKELFEGKDFMHGLSREFNLVQCENCGLVYVNPRPSQKQITGFYPEEYAAHQRYRIKKKHYPRLRKIAKKILRRGTKVKLKFQGEGKILDIGCGSGKFLCNLKEAGWKCYGVEPSEVASKRARELGLNVLTGDILSAAYSQDFFDVIVLNHTLEHLPNPNEVLREINRILKPDGLLRIYIPNIQSLAAKIFGRYWFNLDVPRHIYHYTPYTLKKILEKNGFKVRKIKYLSSTSGILGSIQYLIREKKGGRKDLRKNKFFCFLTKPLVRIIDMFRMGDSFYIYAFKSNSKR